MSSFLLFFLILLSNHLINNNNNNNNDNNNNSNKRNNIIVNAEGEGCNEFLCGAVVSKCLITQSCQCKLTDCHCCKDCLFCMGTLFTECCSCLDMCPKHNDTLVALAPKSQIGDFEGLPELFETLTAEDDDEQWTTVRFPMRAAFKRRFDNGDAIDRQASLQKYPATVNCTVIFLNACITNKKCTKYCESMGAISYRWFHDGCCECVGANCFNYGINESRCSACPDEKDDELMNGANGSDNDNDENDYGGGGGIDGNVDDSMWDYGESEMPYN